jgi:hypothetical protein
MAERMVILRFQDPDSANTFVVNEHLQEQLGFTPFAMFAVPTKYCDCPDKQRQHVANWVRGRKTGWWLCRNCRRPSKFHTEGIMLRLKQVFGNNVLGG